MILICKACSSNDCVGPDFLAVALTDAFLARLRAWRELAVSLALGEHREEFDSVLLREITPVWFTCAEELEPLLGPVGEKGWMIVEDGDAVITGEKNCPGAVVRTDLDRLQVWPKKFRFTCLLTNTDITVNSEIVFYDDVLGDMR